VSKPKRTPPSLSEFLEIEENDLVRIQFKVWKLPETFYYRIFSVLVF
jgi:hypothetical protein